MQPVQPRKGQQKVRDPPQPAYLLSPRWGSIETAALWTPGLGRCEKIALWHRVVGATLVVAPGRPQGPPLQRDFFTPSQALGSQAPAPVKPRKGRQNRGEFPRRDLFFRPAGAPANQRAFWTQGWHPGLSRKAGSALRAFALAYQYVQKRPTRQEKCPDLYFCFVHPPSFARCAGYDAEQVTRKGLRTS